MANASGRTRVAKARKLSESTGYRVDLIGVTWEGIEGAYTYTFPYLPTQHQVTLRAGDFQLVTDFQITAVTNTQYVDGYRVRRKVVDKWEHEESEEKWSDAQG